MESGLQGKVIAVTGASRGLGAALARALSAEGASLVLGSRSVNALEELAEELGGAAVVECDVRRHEDLRKLVATAIDRHGRLDVMINNAGLAVYGPVEQITPEQIDAMVDTNLKGLIFGCQAAYDAMREAGSGHIVNISSIAGRLHLKNEAVYSATKWGVNGFTGALRLEGRRHGIKVTDVSPGGIATPFWDEQESPPFSSRVVPQRDFMRPEEVAQTVVQVLKGSPGYTLQEVVMAPMF